MAVSRCAFHNGDLMIDKTRWELTLAPESLRSTVKSIQK